MDVFAGIRQNRFVIVGRVGMDLFTAPGDATEDSDSFTADMGGSSANIAAGIVKLGWQAALVTSVSDDAVGRFCLNKLRHYGVDATHVKRVGGEARNSLAVYESRVERHQSVIYRNGAADFALTCDDVAAVDFAGCAALVITGTALADAGSRRATMAALAAARAAGAVCVMDVDYRPYSWASSTEAQAANLAAAQACDIVVGNDVEFGLLAGDMAKGLGVARDLVAHSASIAVYKMGEKGAVTVSKSQEFTTGIYRTQALKPTGAGDAFMGGFLAALARGDALRRAVLRGSAAAALVVSRVGCAPACPTIPELDAFLAARPEPI